MTQELSQMKTVLLFERDDAVCGLIESILKSADYQLVITHDDGSALSLAQTEAPDLMILDLTQEPEDGLQLCRSLRAWYGEPILVLTNQAEEEFVISLLDAGADAYITMPIKPAELLARLRAMLRVRPMRLQNRQIVRSGELEVDLGARSIRIDGKEVRLTRTEFNILAFLARHQGRAVSMQMILENVWGPIRGDYTQSLRVHIGHIRHKIERNPSRPRYLMTERGGRYRFSSKEANIEEGISET
jgi:two-component system, OmpR family, KDP operon response regulator KdpE